MVIVSMSRVAILKCFNTRQKSHSAVVVGVSGLRPALANLCKMRRMVFGGQGAWTVVTF